MSVTIRKIKNKDLSTSLYLDIYQNGKRYKEFLKDLKLVKVITPVDRFENKEKLNLAKQIKLNRELQIQSNEEGIITNQKNKIEIKTYFENYINNYQKKDKRNIIGAYNKFLNYLDFEKIKLNTLKEIQEIHIEGYKEYLINGCYGEGANSYFARFKKVLTQAVKDKVIISNPANFVTIKRDENITKDVLTIDEIQILANTSISNNNIKNAFLFSCFTGLRWVDIKVLCWENINLKTNILKIKQSKTGKDVEITLNKTALSLLPTKTENKDLLFELPSHTGALKTLRNWLKKAQIEKHITWHCARHSFATNLIYHKTEVLIVSKLLGHNTLKYTQRYTHIANDLKKIATDNLPTININNEFTNE